jgi:hypothetical protein
VQADARPGDLNGVPIDDRRLAFDWLCQGRKRNEEKENEQW